jgi:hypothetical protein
MEDDLKRMEDDLKKGNEKKEDDLKNKLKWKTTSSTI